MRDDNYLEKSEVVINDFRGQNLKGKSFKGKNISWANFSDADIRGANFSGATLIGADFRGAEAGLQRRSKGILVILLFFMSALAGFISTLTVFWIAWQLTYEKSRIFTSIVFFLILFAVFLVANTSKGLLSAIGTVPISVAVITPVAGVIMKAGSGHPTAAGAGAWMAAIAVAGAVFVAMAVTGTRVVATTRIAAVTVAVALGGAVIATVVGRAAGTPDPLSPIANRELEKVEVGVIMAVVVAITLTLLSIYIAVRVLANDKKYTFVQGFAIALCAAPSGSIAFTAIAGTSFCGANLTEADFTKAKLKSTNFQGANITRTRWYKARELEWAKVDGTILSNSAVQELLVSGKGNYKSFVGLNFQGANLAEAELVNANFTKADLSDATLVLATLINADFTQANLSRATFVKANLQEANLSKTLALGTIFCEAKLTAACIESWTIDDTTLLEESFCDYVYLKENEKERYPSSGKFAPRDFEKLFKEVINTVDFIFHNAVNKEAFIYSWQKLYVDNEGIKLDIQGIERKEDGIIVVK